MPALNLDTIEKRMTEVEASYQRQLALAGKFGYDPALTESLKKDLDWLRDQKRSLSDLQRTETISENQKNENQIIA